MGKKDFDIEFDFDEEYDFDPKAFLGPEEFEDNIDPDAFSDADLGLTERSQKQDGDDTAEEDGSFDPDEDLDLDAFLSMSEEDEDAGETDGGWIPGEDPSGEDDDAYQDEVLDQPEDEEAEETDMNEQMDYNEEDELLDEAAYGGEDDVQEESYEFEEDEEYDEEEDDDDDRRPRQKKERKPIQLPKITLPKLKTPNIFTKFYDLYFAPVLDKNWQNPEDPPQDAEYPRRRRRKTKTQVFKEVYLPPILACVCLILVLSFVIGSLSNVIEQRRIQQQAEDARKESSISAEAQALAAALAAAQEAERLASGYDYEAAIAVLDTLPDLSQNQELSTKRAEYLNALASMVEYRDTSLIPNLSFHHLIEDMAKAKQDATYGGKYNRNFVTTSEFSKILQQLYDNGYVLVDFDSFVGTKTDIDGKTQYEAIPMLLPADKKPVMITQTMVNYYAYMVDGDGDGEADAKGDGFANKLVLDPNGDIRAEYINSEGQTMVGNYDLIPILEDFIKTHPDFSYRGARAIVAVTGDEGVFGYRCNQSYIGTKGREYYDQQVAGAKQIADALRAKGYTLASYTYKNQNYTNFNAQTIKADMGLWNQEVANVIGNMDVFVFAQQGNLTDYNGASFDVMYDNGFRFYISNATNAANATTTINSTYVRQNRLMVTGNSMQWNPSWFTGLFNCSAVLETSIRGDVPN